MHVQTVRKDVTTAHLGHAPWLEVAATKNSRKLLAPKARHAPMVYAAVETYLSLSQAEITTMVAVPATATMVGATPRVPPKPAESYSSRLSC